MQHAEKMRKPLLALAEARANARTVSFDDLPAPPFVGAREIEPDARRARAVHRLAVLLPRVGPEGQVPGDSREPGGARALRRRAGAPAHDPSGRGAATAGVYGYWPAHAEGDDIVVADTRFSTMYTPPNTSTQPRFTERAIASMDTSSMVNNCSSESRGAPSCHERRQRPICLCGDTDCGSAR